MMLWICLAAVPIPGPEQIPITVLQTWPVPYVSEISDLGHNGSLLILRSDADQALFLADPWNLSYQGEIPLPPGASGTGAAYDPSYTHHYYINHYDTTPLILHCPGTGDWEAFPNPAGASGGSLDFHGNFGFSDLLFQVVQGEPVCLYGVEPDGTGFEVYPLEVVNGEVGGMTVHDMATSDGEFPYALILTTRFGHGFFFYVLPYPEEEYVLYAQEPCPLPVAESLGLTWMTPGYVYWAHRGEDGAYSVSLLFIEVFGGLEESFASPLPLPQALEAVCNPSPGTTGLRVQLAREEAVTLDVYDISGRRVATLHRGNLPPGTTSFSYSGAPGVYTAVLARSGSVERLRFVLTR